MVNNQQFLFDCIPGLFVDNAPPNLIFPVVFPVHLQKGMIFFKYMIGIRPYFLDMDRSFEMLVSQPNLELDRLIGLVVKPEIDIIVKHARTAAERQCPLVVRERIEAMVVPFLYRKRRMKSKPKQEIGQLAYAASDTGFDLAVRQEEAFDVPFLRSRFSDRLPKREDLPRTDHNPVYMTNA